MGLGSLLFAFLLLGCVLGYENVPPAFERPTNYDPATSFYYPYPVLPPNYMVGDMKGFLWGNMGTPENDARYRVHIGAPRVVPWAEQPEPTEWVNPWKVKDVLRWKEKHGGEGYRPLEKRERLVGTFAKNKKKPGDFNVEVYAPPSQSESPPQSSSPPASQSQGEPAKKGGWNFGLSLDKDKGLTATASKGGSTVGSLNLNLLEEDVK